MGNFVIYSNDVLWRVFESRADELALVIKKITSGGTCMICVFLLLVLENLQFLELSWSWHGFEETDA
jgi:hypothetical protein